MHFYTKAVCQGDIDEAEWAKENLDRLTAFDADPYLNEAAMKPEADAGLDPAATIKVLPGCAWVRVLVYPLNWVAEISEPVLHGDRAS